MTTRRMILKTAGAAVLVAGSGFAWWAGTRTPLKAIAPWDNAKKGFGDPRLDALAYAILAPNPHNRQPWLIELVGQNGFNLRCDLDRRLPMTDPFDRQITIGLGCFLELFQMAARHTGYETRMELFPDGEPQPRLDGRRIACVELRKAATAPDPLFDQVFYRRSTKEPFDTNRPVSGERLRQLILNESIGGTVENVKVAKLRELSWKAHEMEVLTPRTMQESVDLMRFGKAEVEANPDGIDFSGIGNELLNKTGMMTRGNVGDPSSVSFDQGLKIYHEMLHSAMGYVWITSPGNSRSDQIRAGRDWIRLNLKTTELGLAIHPISQALQEYPEMDQLYKELHSFLNVAEPSRVQMFARIGYGPGTPPSPRWPLTSRIVNA